MTNLRSGIARVVKRLVNTFAGRVAKRYVAASGGTWATAISWNILFSFFPIVVAISLILGLALGSAHLGPTLERDIAGALPGENGTLILGALRSFHAAAGPLAIVSFFGLFWSGSCLFGTIDQGLDALYPVPARSFLRQQLMAVSMIAVFTLLVLAGTASASLVHVLPSTVATFVPRGVSGIALQILFGLTDGILLFGTIYFFVPNRKQRLLDILPGTLLAAALFEVFMLLFPFYFKLQHGFNTYGSTFAVFFLFLTFAFFLAQIVMLGGAVNAELHPPEAGAFPRAGSSISPNAQAEADDQALDRTDQGPADRRRRRVAGRPPRATTDKRHAKIRR